VPADVKLVDPVYIEDNVTLVNSTLGPNVSVGAGSRIEGSVLRDTIVGVGATISNSKLSSSIVGDATHIDGANGQLNVSDHSVVKIRG
jgi:glucose-1-phosphate thymidylyltransferase